MNGCYVVILDGDIGEIYKFFDARYIEVPSDVVIVQHSASIIYIYTSNNNNLSISVLLSTHN